MAPRFFSAPRTARAQLVALALALVGALAVPLATPQGTAAMVATATGCYNSARPQTISLIGAIPTSEWTIWYTGVATPSCADLNVKITNYDADCWVYVDAMYYSRAQGWWIDGADDDFWMLPGV